MKRVNEEFIEKARKIHGDKYDYSKVEYINNKTKVCIVCPIHGEFWQRPNNHLSGQGCPHCGGTANIKTEGFIEKARMVHGDKYDYSKVDYVNNKTKVIIVCKKHGEFTVSPEHHLRGVGCPKCHFEKLSSLFSMTKDEFVEKAKSVHEDKYDYSKVDYVNNNTKVCIVCPVHGEFWQTPHNHLSGNGCPKCKGDKLRQDKLKTFDEFVSEANKIHGKKYTYIPPYSGKNIPIEIICPLHGKFKQTPHDHLSGCGCPKCNSSKLELRLLRLFNENSIEHVYLCRKNTLAWLERQSLDFYLPKYNVAVECQGAQHYVPSNFGSKDKDPNDCLRIVRERDERKRSLCEENNVRLLYFSDKKYDDEVIIDENKLLESIKAYGL